jgi:protein-S-isoprenylcysteine O-methyltransferase Ste14
VLVLLILCALLTSVVPIASFPIPFHGVIATLFILTGLGFSGVGFLHLSTAGLPFDREQSQPFGAQYETYCQRVRRWL